VALSLLVCILDVLFFTGGTIASTLIGFGLITTFIASALVTFRYKATFKDEFWRSKDKPAPSIVSRIFSTWLAILIMLFAHFSGRLVQELKGSNSVAKNTD